MNKKDKSEGWRRAKEGMTLAYEASTEEWKTGALECVVIAAKRCRELTVDEVHEVLDEREVTTPNLSALGAVMRAAARAGVIKKSGRMRRIARPASHADVRPVWESLVYTR